MFQIVHVQISKVMLKFLGLLCVLSSCSSFQNSSMLQVFAYVSRFLVCSKFMLKFPRCGCNSVQVSKVFHFCVHGAQVSNVFQVHDPNSSWFGF